MCSSDLTRQCRAVSAFTLLIIALLCLTSIPVVSAFTATPLTTATQLSPGSTISVQVNDLAVGNFFKYRIYSPNLVMVGNSVTSSMQMPFGFKDGSSFTSLTTAGLVTPPGATLTVRTSDGSETTMTSTTNTITSAKNVKKDTYSITMSGTKISADTLVNIDYSVSGTVSDAGTNPSTLSFALTNVNAGTVTIEISDASGVVMTKTYTVVSPPTSTFSGGIPNGGDDTGGAGAPGAGQGQAQVGPQQAPPADLTTSVTLEHDAAGVTENSYTLSTDQDAGFVASVSVPADTQVLSKTGVPVDTISVTPLDSSKVDITALGGKGSIFSFSGQAVLCEPAGTQFTNSQGGVTISFELPADYTGTPTIQYYDSQTGKWSEIVGTITTDPKTGKSYISVTVNHFSIYALFFKAALVEAKPTTQTFGQIIGESTPAAGVSPAATAATPAKTQLAPTETAKSPGFGSIAVIGAFLVIGYSVLRKKE